MFKIPDRRDQIGSSVFALIVILMTWILLYLNHSLDSPILLAFGCAWTLLIGFLQWRRLRLYYEFSTDHFVAHERGHSLSFPASDYKYYACFLMRKGKSKSKTFVFIKDDREHIQVILSGFSRNLGPLSQWAMAHYQTLEPGFGTFENPFESFSEISRRLAKSDGPESSLDSR